jgi:hypothetical protein
MNASIGDEPMRRETPDDLVARRNRSSAKLQQYDVPMTLTVGAESDLESWLKAVAFERIREQFDEPPFKDLGVEWMHAGLGSGAVTFATESEA